MEDTYSLSDDWRQDPREAVLTLLENYTEFVIELEDVTVQGSRRKI